MSTVISKDGTRIGYEKNGSGPGLILVDGAICYRNFGPMQSLSALLAPHFSVYTYDRRGRGESSNSKPYTVEREAEDLEALIDAAGGKAYVFGISSGACLALEAAIQLKKKISKLALYEAPYRSDPAGRQEWKEYRNKLEKALAENCRGDAVVLFMQLVGTPTEQINGMQQAPVWPLFEAVAPTLEYDAEAMGEDRTAPIQRAARVAVPALVMDGGANLQIMPFMNESATALARAIPHAQHRTLEGQTHDVKLEVLAPVLDDFFSQQSNYQALIRSYA